MATNTETGADIAVPANAVLDQQVRELYSKTPLTLAGTLALSVTARIMLSDQPSVSAELDVFMWLVVAVVVCRFAGYLGWRASPDQGGLRWAYLECVFAFLLALAWNYLMFHVFPLPDPIALANLIILVVGILAAGLATQTVYLPAYLSYALPMMLFASISVAVLREDSLHLMIFGFAYSSMCLWFVVIISRSLTNTIVQRLQNERLVEALVEERRKVEEAVRARSNFFAAASHDLRQPVHALSLFLGALRPKGDEAVIVERMQAAVTGLQQLYDRVLDISKLESGRVEVHRAPVDLAPLVAGSLDKHRLLAADRNLSLTAHLASAWANTDSVLFLRIVDNLAVNALRFTQHGGVSVRLSEADGVVSLVVEDTGPGIAPDQLDRIFDSYVQLPAPTMDGPQGFGLGLSIVHSLCELLGGEIVVASQVGEGSRFELTLAACPAVAPVALDELSVGDGDVANILVLDDDPAIQQAMDVLLTRWGHTPTIPETWEAWPRHGRYDVVITDHELWQGHTGFEVGQLLKDAGRDGIPLLMLTGDTHPEVRRRCIDNGILYLQKPLKPAQLRAAVNRVRRRPG